MHEITARAYQLLEELAKRDEERQAEREERRIRSVMETPVRTWQPSDFIGKRVATMTQAEFSAWVDLG